MRWVGFVVCCIAACTGNAAEIYRCSGAGGEVLFTDVACPTGRPQMTQPINSVDLALPDMAPSHRGADAANPRNPLPQGKHARGSKWREAQARADEAAAPQARVRAKGSRERDVRGSPANSIETAERRCAAARDRLDAVHATMRRGYSAASAGRMQTRLQDARARVDRDCAR